MDALDWVSDDGYEILGHRIVVRCTSAQFAADVRRLLRSFPVASINGAAPDLTLSFIVAAGSRSRTVRPFHFAFCNYAQVGRTVDYWQLFTILERQLSKYLGEEVRDFFLLHAGAVAKRGAGIVFPGPSGSGKSSLTLALLRKGYRYLSDEMAVVDPVTAQLQPYPKPLAIKDRSIFPDIVDRNDLWYGAEAGDAASTSVWYVQAEDVFPDAMGRCVPVRFIIFPTYKTGANPGLRLVGPEETARKLLQNSANFARLRTNGLALMAKLVDEAECYELACGDLEETAELIDQLVR